MSPGRLAASRLGSRSRSRCGASPRCVSIVYRRSRMRRSGTSSHRPWSVEQPRWPRSLEGEVGGMVTWPRDAPAGAETAEAESYRILRSRIDLSRLPKHSRDVTERVIYASADFDYATDLVCDEEALAAAVAVLAAGAPVIVDAAMVAAGITGCPVICKIGEPLTQRLSRTAN